MNAAACAHEFSIGLARGKKKKPPLSARGKVATNTQTASGG